MRTTKTALAASLLLVAACVSAASECEADSVQGSWRDIDWAAFAFHDIVELPQDARVLDLSAAPADGTSYSGIGERSYACRRGVLGRKCRRAQYVVGRYNETRPGLYESALFHDTGNCLEGYCGLRNVHMGLDLGAPVGTAVRAFYGGDIVHMGFNAALGDTGHTIVTHHVLNGTDLYALHGHLSASSMHFKRIGMALEAGDTIGWVGDAKDRENGGWPPHLHLQLAMFRPETHDLPGVVSAADRTRALEAFPDPQLVLRERFYA